MLDMYPFLLSHTKQYLQDIQNANIVPMNFKFMLTVCAYIDSVLGQMLKSLKQLYMLCNDRAHSFLLSF